MDSSLDKDTMIKLITSEAFEDFIEYTDIMNLLHNNISKFGEVLTSLYKIDNESIDRIHENQTCTFIGYLIYKSIINNDTTSIELLHSYILSLHNTSQVLSHLVIKTYKENNLDIFLTNKWIINYDPISFISWIHDRHISIHIVQFIIENYNHYNIDSVWKHICTLFRSDTNFDTCNILQMCIETQLPQLSEKMYDIYQSYDHKNGVDVKAIDMMLSHGFQPTTRLVSFVFTWRIYACIKLFIKHNINIKQIVNSQPVSDWSEEMITFMETLNIDMPTYLQIISK